MRPTQIRTHSIRKNHENIDKTLDFDVISGENGNYLLHIADNHHNKGVSVEEKVCCSETRKEQDNIELVGEVDLSPSFSVVKTKFSLCSRDVHNSCTSDGGKYEVDLQMDSDSRKKPKNVFKKDIIDTPNMSISLMRESCLMQMFSTSVRPISLGSVVHGKLWCSKLAIYPKGFKSRVNFFSILNPTRICSYISEVIDAGFLGPLFKASNLNFLDKSWPPAFTLDLKANKSCLRNNVICMSVQQTSVPKVTISPLELENAIQQQLFLLRD